MTKHTHFTVETRAGKDQYEGDGIRFNVDENGTLTVTDNRATIAAYPKGNWHRATPTTVTEPDTRPAINLD